MPEKAVMSDGLQPAKTGAFRAVRGLGKEIVRRIKNVYIEGNPQMLFHSDPLPHEIHETWPTDRSRRGFKTFETWVEGLDAIEFGGHSHLAIPESRWPSWLRDGCPAAKVKIGAFGSVNDIAKYPEWDENVRKRKKVGVPGGTPYDYKDAKNFFRRWRGSGWQAALTHWTCYFHIAFFWAMFGVFQASNRDFVTEGFSRTVQNLVFFLITFYTGQVLGRYLGRWQDLMAMNGAIGHGGMKACANLKAEYAYNMVRLMNAYFQVYFRLTSGPRGMSPRAWWYLIQNGYLTESEVAVLSERGKPGIVLYTWTMQLLRTATDQGQCDSVQAARIEFEFTRARGLSAKQAAQELLPFPFPYFHVFTMMVHVYLIGFSLNQASNTALVFNQNRDPDEFGLTEDFEIPPAGRYIREMISTHVVIILIMAIWRVDVWLSAPFGTDAVDYDLGFDIEFQLVEAIVMLQVAHDAQYGIKPSQTKPAVLHVIKESSSHTDSAHASAVPAGGGRRNLGNAAAGGGSSASPPQAPADGEDICINLDPQPVDRYSTADGAAAPPDGEVTQDLLKPQVIGR